MIFFEHFLTIAGAAAVYFLPTLVAIVRHAANGCHAPGRVACFMIALFNLSLGWTVFIWAGCLICAALRYGPRADAAIDVTPTPIPPDPNDGLPRGIPMAKFQDGVVVPLRPRRDRDAA